MQLPSCVRCGAPLPAVAPDPNHPEWCAACAARALAPPTAPPPTTVPWGTPVAVEPARPVRETRLADGLLVGLAACGIGGGAMWAIAAFGQLERWHYGALLVGLITGLGVLIGARRGGPLPGLIAAVLSLVAVLVTVYFADRSLQIASLEDAGLSSDVPLWQGAQAMVDIVRDWIEFDVASAAAWLLAPVAALVVAGWPGRRAPI